MPNMRVYPRYPISDTKNAYQIRSRYPIFRTLFVIVIINVFEPQTVFPSNRQCFPNTKPPKVHYSLNPIFNRDQNFPYKLKFIEKNIDGTNALKAGSFFVFL